MSPAARRAAKASAPIRQTPVEAVIARSQAQGTQLALMLLVGYRANEDGFCWMRPETVCAALNVGDRARQKATGELAKAGELATVAGTGRGHDLVLYRVLLGRPAEDGDQLVMLSWAAERSDSAVLKRTFAGQLAALLAELHAAESANDGSPFPEPGQDAGADQDPPAAEPETPNDGSPFSEPETPNDGSPFPAETPNGTPNGDAPFAAAVGRSALEALPLGADAPSGAPAANGSSSNGDKPPPDGRVLYGAYLDLCRKLSGNPRYRPDKRSEGMLGVQCAEAAEKLAAGVWTAQAIWDGMIEHAKSDLNASQLSSCISRSGRGGVHGGGRRQPDLADRTAARRDERERAFTAALAELDGTAGAVAGQSRARGEVAS